jgi:Ca2+-binding EF-hand superfamily protein
MDVDKSGGITYDEFLRVARSRLGITGLQISEQRLRVLWCHLDADESDVLRVDEFGRFLRIAPVEHASEREKDEQAAARRKKLMLHGSATAEGGSRIDESPPTAEMRAQLVKEGVSLPTEEELLALSAAFTTKLEAAREANSTTTRTFSRGGSHTFMNLIAQIDEDGSGVVTFDELKHVARSKLSMTPDELPGRQLRALWCALDADDSCTIAIDELAAFLTGNARILRKMLGASEARSREAQEREERVQAILKIQSMHRGKKARQVGKAKAKAKQKLHTGEAEPTKEIRARLKEEAVPLPSLEELLSLSALFTERLEAARYAASTSARTFVRGKASTFMNLFAELDEDKSGVVTLDELQRVARKKLELTPSELSAKGLLALWCALDADDSNSVAIDEMGAFLQGNERVLRKLVAVDGGDWRRAEQG